MKKKFSIIGLIMILLFPVFIYASDITETANEEAVHSEEDETLVEDSDEEDIFLEEPVTEDLFSDTSDTDYEETDSLETEMEILEDDKVLNPAVEPDVDEVVSEKIEEPPDNEIVIFTEENAQFLDAVSAEETEIIEEIENGSMIALAAADAAADQYRIFVSSGALYCDEVWDKSIQIATRYRRIQYTDSAGNTRNSPLYCLDASKLGIDPKDSGDLIKAAAVSFLSNSTIKKILYFGYGGPGDICDIYDPTCEHVDWTNWHNRYVFTHQALSKIYANDVAGATAAQIAHVGLNRFITKINSQTIPNRSAMKIKAINTAGNTVTANPISVNLVLYKEQPVRGYDWLEEAYQNGFQITRLLTVVDSGNAQNGITVSRKATDNWQLVYWTSAADVEANLYNPTVLGKGRSVSLKHGYRFRIVFPETISGTVKWTFPMSLLPVKYVLVDGETQVGKSGYQDFGAYVYQGTRGSVTINMVPQKTGMIVLTKTCDMTGGVLSGATYGLYAAEDLYSGAVKRYNINTLVERAETDLTGKIIFRDLLPGKYYIKELSPSSSYLLDENTYYVTVKAGGTHTQNVTDVPDIKGNVLIEKLSKETGIVLKDAEFTLYTWNNLTGKYENGKILQYDETAGKYYSETLIYNKSNKGKFLIKETKNPAGYTGNWSQEIILSKPGTEENFEFQVYNEPIVEKRLEIRKRDADTKELLMGAEFTLYEWNGQLQAYSDVGEIIPYDEAQERYISSILEITETNQGMFRIEETKNPEGYTGEWSKEVNLNEENLLLQFIVENSAIPKKYGKIKIKKTDALTGESLPGAHFYITQWNQQNKRYEDTLGMQAVMEYDIQEMHYLSQELELTEENNGKFQIEEIQPPDGYVGNWKHEITMEEDGEVLEFSVTNEPVQLPTGKITITKMINESEIVWAHGNPVFQFVIEGKDIRGNSRKYEDFVLYLNGGYEVDENGFAILSITISDIPIGTYRIYEKPVLRYYLKDVIAETSNVRIQKFREPAYDMLPSTFANAEAVLTVETNNAAVTFVNEKSRFDDYSHNSVVRNQIPIKY